ncbi:MAG: hypothetical protein LBQ02_02900 [Candidatus Nomurabacteria bacterium]|jgi:hypothetical protein|nr:hypothetical protein [Candidatus Nomurabacteria bacterium]
MPDLLAQVEERLERAVTDYRARIADLPVDIHQRELERAIEVARTVLVCPTVTFFIG